MKLALIGHGAIARQILNHYARGAQHQVALILDVADTRVAGGPPVTTRLEDVIAAQPDLVVECAGHSAVDAYAVPILEAGLNLLIVSIGALADRELRSKVFAAAQHSKGRVLLPAGAIAGIDGLVAARYGGLETVQLRSRKAPLSWSGAAGVEGVDLAAIRSAQVIFSGPADEAARLFPKNANVAATVALAGLGFSRTAVELVADPAATRNIHELEAEGAFGRLRVVLENVPSPDNPKTSALTALSIIRLIENQQAPIVM